MENAKYFRQKLAGRKPCLGTCVTFTDPTVTDALAESPWGWRAGANLQNGSAGHARGFAGCRWELISYS